MDSRSDGSCFSRRFRSVRPLSVSSAVTSCGFIRSPRGLRSRPLGRRRRGRRVACGCGGVSPRRWGIVGGLLVGYVLSALYGLASTATDLRARPSRFELRRMLAFGLPLVPSGIALWLVWFIDRVMLARLSGLGDVGEYAIANRLTALLLLAVLAFNLAFGPYILSLHVEISSSNVASARRRCCSPSRSLDPGRCAHALRARAHLAGGTSLRPSPRGRRSSLACDRDLWHLSRRVDGSDDRATHAVARRNLRGGSGSEHRPQSGADPARGEWSGRLWRRSAPLSSSAVEQRSPRSASIASTIPSDGLSLSSRLRSPPGAAAFVSTGSRARDVAIKLGCLAGFTAIAAAVVVSSSSAALEFLRR